MKLFSYGLVLGLLPLAQAVSSQKSFIVTYPKDTPDSVLTTAKDAITEAGGLITHEYHLIKGFAAKASASVIENVSTLSSAYSPSVEEDQVVSIADD
ncbi:conserved hypothetical protein [Paecilomyces variotii No. 5]|uniref:Uncharacterized protein n=1 Tax=Byssochlamys spectabilis (strain No. 5 / NBRC 109023) TaxID=1356009 RepID=V5I2U7_BYSSN|nr:conserved hypothetical protein [Paecilomyces variotii No. 5]